MEDTGFYLISIGLFAGFLAAVGLLVLYRRDPGLFHGVQGTSGLAMFPSTPARNDLISHDDKMERWNGMADELGLERLDNYPKTRLHVGGEVDGVEVHVRRESNADGNSVTCYEVDVSEVVPDEFGLERQVASEFLAGFGVANREDIYVGNDELDRAFVFHGRSKQQLREFVWQPGVEEAIAELIEFPKLTYVEDGTLTVVEHGVLPSVDHGVERIRAGLRVVEKLRRASDERAEAKSDTAGGEGWRSPS